MVYRKNFLNKAIKNQLSLLVAVAPNRTKRNRWRNASACVLVKSWTLYVVTVGCNIHRWCSMTLPLTTCWKMYCELKTKNKDDNNNIDNKHLSTCCNRLSVELQLKTITSTITALLNHRVVAQRIWYREASNNNYNLKKIYNMKK